MNIEPTVFVVDDDELARDSVCAVVKTAGVAYRAFPSAEKFLETYNPSHPGCLVTDVRMPGMSGLELQQQLMQDKIPLPVIVISSFGSARVATEAMQQGAITFLEKPSDKHELFNAVSQALVCDRRNREAIAAKQALQEKLENITSKERQVLELMVLGKPNKAIAHELGIAVRTVEKRRKIIFNKTGTDSIAELVHLVLEAR